jgi:hypothetical protein
MKNKLIWTDTIFQLMFIVLVFLLYMTDPGYGIKDGLMYVSAFLFANIVCRIIFLARRMKQTRLITAASWMSLGFPIATSIFLLFLLAMVFSDSLERYIGDSHGILGVFVLLFGLATNLNLVSFILYLIGIIKHGIRLNTE